MASQRKKKNRIIFLKDQQVVRHTSEVSKATIVVSYFQSLFTSSSSKPSELITCRVDSRVTSDMNNQLLKAFTPDEIKSAVFQMGLIKALGPNGFPTLFYQKHWDLIGDEVTSTVLQYLNTVVMPPGRNKTRIVLIPKVQDPQDFSQYRPISLCNVLYKIIVKVLANRLKLILPSIISKFQSAFVPNRQITENVLIAYELMHALKNKHRGNNGCMAFKLDMSKAYDSVEWRFLEDIM